MKKFITFTLLLVIGFSSIANAQRSNVQIKNQSKLKLHSKNIQHINSKGNLSLSGKPLEEACDKCDKYLKAGETAKYLVENCRALQTYCQKSFTSGGGVIIEENDTLALQASSGDAFQANAINQVVVFLNGKDKAYTNLMTVVEVFDQHNHRLFTSKGQKIPTYTFNERNKLVSMKGLSELKKVSKKQQHALMIPVKLPKVKTKNAVVKVSLKELDPKTRQYKTVKILRKKVKVK